VFGYKQNAEGTAWIYQSDKPSSILDLVKNNSVPKEKL